jgi:predicted transport protein
VDKEKIKDDPRYPFGLPRVDNANYLWIQEFYSALNEHGRSGFVMANSASDARASELDIRRRLIDAHVVDVMISIGSNFFYTVTLPCTLWFFDRGKRYTERREKVLFIDARHIYKQVDRAHREFTPEQIEFIANIVRLYRSEAMETINGSTARMQEVFPGGSYADVPGLCRFVERIRQSNIDLKKLYYGIGKLIIVQISLGKDDNPQLIFESLNSTGMDLSQADLIRNYVLMGLDTEEQTKLYNDYWYRMEREFRYADGTDQFDRFMRDYLTVKQGVIPNIDRVYASFKSYHHSQVDMPIREIVKDIYRYAEYFINVALLQEEDQDILDALKDISTLKVDVAYPFLLEVYGDYANKRLSKKDFITLLRLVESYVFRRLICGIPTNGLNKVFVTLAKDIDKEHYLESVQATFLAKTRGGRFPHDEEFRAAFVVNYGDKVLVNVENCTIEHIMPQNERLSEAWQEELGTNWKEIQARYLHTIGNLTLTGYNSELGDRPFTEKRDMMKSGFAASPIRLSRNLAKLEHWNKDEIEKRAQELADIAVKAWPTPALSAEQVNQYNMLMQQIPMEVDGPTRLPLVGFVPEGFKIIRRSEKRFHLYRLMQHGWVQYGNGKKAWYAISWFWAGEWARAKQRENEIPLGVGGEEVAVLTSIKPMAGIILDSSNAEDTENGNSYTPESYQHLQGTIRTLFEQLRKRILSLDPSVREEYKKLYIAYKTSTNFVDVVPQAKQLRLSLNVKFSEINDPKGLCKDISGLGRWGNGDVEIKLASSEQLNDVMYLIRQAFEKHWEEDDA